MLRTAPKAETVIEHEAGTVRLMPGFPCLTVTLSAEVPRENVRDECWRVAQEALDVHAATHRQAHSTTYGERTFFTWTSGTSGYHLRVVDTLHARWSVSATVEVTAASRATLRAPPPPPIPYHPALRFYRLSQLTEDLFDAFRNSYLCLELLVSEVSPKVPSESEQTWLARVLGGPLASVVPSGIGTSTFVDRVYKYGRLPLFHAKASAAYYVPHGEERSSIPETFESLQMLLASLLHHRVNSRIASGWGRMSEAASDAMLRALLAANGVVFGYGIQRMKSRIAFDLVDSPRVFGGAWGRSNVLTTPNLEAVESLEIVKDGQDWITIDMPATVPLAGVSSISIELRHAHLDIKAPSRLHAS